LDDLLLKFSFTNTSLVLKAFINFVSQSI